MSFDRPSSPSVGALIDLSSSRIVTASPSTVGSVATRTSSSRPAARALSEMRPSCGLRRSAMSSFASTFRRVVTPGVSRFGICCATRRTPSMRKRTTRASSCGSKWMSLAPSSAAWKMIELTSRTSGASEMPSSASRSSSSSPATATAASSTAAFIASEARARRRSSVRTSLWAATKNSIGPRVASRSWSSPRTSCGSVIAIWSVPSATAKGTAQTRSSTGSGITLLASALTPLTARSTSGSPYWEASARATPSDVATPSSRSACENEPPSERARTLASVSSGSRPVSPISSAISALRAPFAGGAGGDVSPLSDESGCTRRSSGWLSKFIGATAFVSADRQVPVEDAVAGEERHHAAEGEKRAERDRHLAGGAAMTGEQGDRGHKRREHGEQQRHRHRPPQRRAQQEGELDVAHAHPARVGERGEQQEEGGAEAGEHPLRRGGERRLGGQDGRGRGQHDPIWDQAPLEIGHRDGHERAAEEGGDRRLTGEAEHECAGGDEERARQLDERVPERDGGAAAAAAAAQDQVREKRNVVVPGDRRLARHAG